MIFLKQVAVDLWSEAALRIHQQTAGQARLAQHFGQPADERHDLLAARRGFVTHLAQMPIHGVGVHPVRSAHPAQEMRPMLPGVRLRFKIMATFLKAQPLNMQAGALKAFDNLLADGVIGQHHHVEPALHQGRQHFRLQKVHQRQAMIGRDKNRFWFRHSASLAISGRNRLGRSHRRFLIKRA